MSDKAEITPLEELKFNLQETKFPHFSDDELKVLLAKCKDNVLKASYEGCMIKSYDFSSNLGPINITVGKDYWSKRARIFKRELDRENRKKRKTHRTMTRADEI